MGKEDCDVLGLPVRWRSTDMVASHNCVSARFKCCSEAIGSVAFRRHRAKCRTAERVTGHASIRKSTPRWLKPDGTSELPAEIPAFAGMTRLRGMAVTAGMPERR